jgi:hypothetical protein
VTAVVGVHGVWNLLPDRPADAAVTHLSEVWTRNLAKALQPDAPLPVTVAYYAPHLVRGRDHGVPDPETLDEQAREWLERWDQELRPRTEVDHGRLTRPVRQIIDGIARRTGLSPEQVGAFVAVLLPELQTYFRPDRPQPRHAARATVAAAIRQQEPAVVIAHSMGSIVTYETLWAEPDLTVDLLVTVGSPLGLRGVILERLDPAPDDARGGRPPGVKQWVNIADPGDLCAVPRWLARTFPGISRDVEAPIGVFGFHKVARYLACAAMGELLRPYARPGH